MGTTRDDGSQQSMWVSAADLPRGGGHPFYERLNRILEAAGFDAFVEGLCAQFYAAKMPDFHHGLIGPICSLLTPCQPGVLPVSVRRGVSPRAVMHLASTSSGVSLGVS